MAVAGEVVGVGRRRCLVVGEVVERGVRPRTGGEAVAVRSRRGGEVAAGRLMLGTGAVVAVPGSWSAELVEAASSVAGGVARPARAPSWAVMEAAFRLVWYARGRALGPVEEGDRLRGLEVLAGHFSGQ